MKLVGICNNSVADVYLALKAHGKKVGIIKGKKIKDSNYLLCPCANTFFKYFDTLSKSKSIIVLFDNVLFLTEIGCPIVDCKVNKFSSYVSTPFHHEDIDVVAEDKQYSIDYLPNFVGYRPKGKIGRELFYLLDCSSIGDKRAEFLLKLYNNWFAGNYKIGYEEYVKNSFDKHLLKRFFDFIKSKKDFVKCCKLLYSFKQQGKGVNYNSYATKEYPASFIKWLFNDYRLLNNKIVHFGENENGNSK